MGEPIVGQFKFDYKDLVLFANSIKNKEQLRVRHRGQNPSPESSSGSKIGGPSMNDA